MKARATVFSLLALPPFLLVAASAQAQDSEVAVTVDGERVTMSGKAIRTPDGAILVPLRGVFQKLGAAVQYSATSKAIIAVRGTTTVTLKIGELTGYINGTSYPLTTAAQVIDGATLVPLRFVAQAFGAKVRFSPITRIASVTTKGGLVEPDPLPGQKPQPLGQPQQPTTTEPVATPQTIPGLMRGTIVDLGDSLTIKDAEGVQEKLALALEPVILVKSGKNPSIRRDISSLRVGDQVVVRVDGDGKALVVEAYVSGAAPPRVKTALQPAVERGTKPVVASLKPTKLEITRLQHGLKGEWAKAGTVIPFTLGGTPGAKATLILPEVPGAENVAMTEKSPGVYMASVTIPEGLTAKEVHATGRLNFEDIASPEATLDGKLGIDSTPPALNNFAPAASASLTELRPQLTGVYADSGSGINTKKCFLKISGKDVTADAVFTEGFFSYKPATPLPPGPVDVILVVRDEAGNELRKEWNFTLQGAATEPIQNVTISPSDKPLDYGDVLTVKVVGAPGSKASFSLGEVVKDKLLREDTPGAYVGTYTVRRNDAVAGAQVTVTLTTPAGKTETKTVSPLVGGTNNPAPTAGYSPIIDTPQEGASVGERVVLTGRALPGASLRVTLKYNGRKLVVPTSGLISTVTVKADDKGNWSTQPIVIKVPRDLTGVTLAVEAVALGAGGALSTPATVKFRR